MNRKEIEDRLDLIADSMPIARDIIEEEINVDNIDYIDFFTEKTANLEGFAYGLKKGLKDVPEENVQDILEYILDILPIMEDYTDFITETVNYLQPKKK